MDMMDIIMWILLVSMFLLAMVTVGLVVRNEIDDRKERKWRHRYKPRGEDIIQWRKPER